MTPLGFARVNVAEMNFDERNRYRCERITQCETGVCVRARIHNHTVHVTAPCVQLIDKLPFTIVLRTHEFHIQFACNYAQPFFHLRERRVTVDGRLPDAEEIQIGSVEQADFHAWFSPLSQAENCARSSLTG